MSLPLSSAPAPATSMDLGFAVGIDENGLGPRLGPLVVTSILARTTDAGARVAGGPPRGRMRARLGDSKALVSYGDSALGEAWARALLARTQAGASPASVDELVFAMTLDGRERLRAPCPDDHAGQCWSTAGEAPLSAEPALVARVGRDLARLASAGVEVLSARVVIACTKQLNAETARGRSRFEVDLHAMERLVLRARDEAGADLSATCGKVGGFDRYADHFGPMAGRLHAVIEEGRARSTYALPGVGTVAFVRDADASNLLVCLASLVGKWVRDALMNRIVRYHRAHDPDLPDASGYHDPVTSRFVAASALTRKRRGLPDECFERTSLARLASAAATSSPTARVKAKAKAPTKEKKRRKAR